MIVANPYVLDIFVSPGYGLNLEHATGLFLYPLKTSESQVFWKSETQEV